MRNTKGSFKSNLLYRNRMIQWWSSQRRWMWALFSISMFSVVVTNYLLKDGLGEQRRDICRQYIDFQDYNDRLMSWPDTVDLVSPGGRAQTLPYIKTDKIKAYVLTTNSSNIRYLEVRDVLVDCGFYPIPVKPIHWNDSFITQIAYPYKSPTLKKTWSNKYSFRMVWDWITSDPTLDTMEIPFSLIFEDDIKLNSQFKPYEVEKIVKNIAKLTQDVGYSGIFYLGYGMGYGVPNTCDESLTHEKVISGVRYNVCSGRLFHATGLLKYEGKWLADKVSKLAQLDISQPEIAYMDAEVQIAFSRLNEKYWPYAAAWDKQEPTIPMNETHRGVFYQDRKAHPSTIGGWWEIPQADW
eukprot:TRINITY_DN9000_c0_g1_i1.p1 TRINITY_DN9000_c0_g1~~TRINITY_DN9000_c0_g1_i1.p1  ORF type:complete len:353 (-),score=68.56 TRINITY_DN9000_c0_g1_i1:110-1168(-)